MDLTDIAKQSKDITGYRLGQKLDYFFRKNPSYKHLVDNREIIDDLINKYEERRRHRIATTDMTIRRDMYHLYQKRLELKLTKNDLDDIRKFLTSLKD